MYIFLGRAVYTVPYSPERSRKASDFTEDRYLEVASGTHKLEIRK
jgi:hypothetical protein